MVLSSLSETSSIWTHRPCSCPDRHRNPVIEIRSFYRYKRGHVQRSFWPQLIWDSLVMSEIQKRTIAAAMHLHSDRSGIPVNCDHVLCVTAGEDCPPPSCPILGTGTVLRNVKYVGYRVQTEQRPCLPSSYPPPLFFAEKQAADYQWVIVGLFLFLLEASRIFPAETEIHLHYILDNFTELDL
jgi:hypothetical protein